jgi:hypothetical protein
MPRNPLIPVALPSFADYRQALVKAVGSKSVTKMTPPVDVTGAEAPLPLDPINESRQAYLPYRGTEMHGVPSPAPYVPDAEGYGDGMVDVRYDDTDKGGTVIDVRVISDSAEQIKAFRTDQFTVPSDRVIQLMPRARNRTAFKVRNLNQGGNRVWVASDPSSVNVDRGWPIMGNSQESFTTTEALYAIAAGPNGDGSVLVAVFTDFTQDA